MKLCIFALLVFSLVSFAQPVEGPYLVVSGDSAIHHIHVAARNDSVADVFYQIGNDAYHVAFALDIGTVYSGPNPFPDAAPGYARTLEDAIATVGGWQVAAYDLSADYHAAVLIAGSDNVGDSTEFESGRNWCPDQMPLCCFGSNIGFAFSGTPDNSFMNWTQSWVCHWNWGWEGGVDYFFVRPGSDDPFPVSPFAYQGPVAGRTFALSGDTLLTAGWTYSEFQACSTSTGNCFGISSHIYCEGVPIEVLPVSSGRMLALCESLSDPFWGWDYDQRFIELDFVEGTCTDLQTLDANPLAASSNPDFGFAWLSQPSSGLLLNRADTTGTLVYSAGVVYWPLEGEQITRSNVAMTENGKIMVVWTTQHSGSDSTQLWIEAVDWNTPLSANPEPERTAVRRYTLNAYPNPFNSTVRISFDLPSRQHVQLQVFDVLGRNIATLVDEPLAAGSHSITWSPEGSSGIYFTRLRTGDNVRTEKLMYLR